MRRFGGQRTQNVLERIGLEDDVPVEAGMVSNAMRRTQEQAERKNLHTRNRDRQYDDVLNKQREVIYAIRRDIFMGEKVVDTWKYVEEVLLDVVGQYVSDAIYPENWDMEALSAEVNRFYPSTIEFGSLDVKELSSDEVLEMVLEDARARLEERKAEWEERTAELHRDAVLDALVDRGGGDGGALGRDDYTVHLEEGVLEDHCPLLFHHQAFALLGN